MARQKKPDTLADPLNPPLKAKSRTRSQADKRANAFERRAATVTRRNDLLPALTPVLRRTDELVAYDRQLRRHSTADIIEAANAIASKGFVVPIIVGRDGVTILDGELRLKAGQWLQMDEVPCIMLEHLTPTEERALRISLNRLGQRREWDLEDLRLELAELVIEEEPIDLLGFDDIELDQIMADDPEEAEVPVPERDEGVTVTRLGDIWQMGDHRLICGDARDPSTLALLLRDEKVQALLTDPPYNIAISTIVSTKHREFAHASGEMSDDEFAAFLADVLGKVREVMDDGAIGFAFMDWRQIEILLRVVRECGYHYLNLIPWVKANAGMGSFYRSQHELVAMIKKPGEHNNRIQLGSKGRNRANVWFAPGAGTQGTDARQMLTEHPTSKPVQLLADAVIDVTEPDDLVLDCFAGSGSTLMAAERTGRRARLVELDCGYCDVILRRWRDHKGEEPVLEATGQRLAEVMAARSAARDEGDPNAGLLETLRSP